VAFLSQHRFPGLWNFFQYVIGGTVDKRRLCLKHYAGESAILEVGCSLGNISKAFTALPNIEFTGVDIDPVVIEYAQKAFSHTSNFKFVCEDLRSFSEKKDTLYDYILFAGICHHIEDIECVELLNVASRSLLQKGGKLVVVDPLLPLPEDSGFVHSFLKLEQGKFLRTGQQLEDIVKETEEVRLVDKHEYLIGASPLHRPVCARFGVYCLGH